MLAAAEAKQLVACFLPARGVELNLIQTNKSSC